MIVRDTFKKYSYTGFVQQLFGIHNILIYCRRTLLFLYYDGFRKYPKKLRLVNVGTEWFYFLVSGRNLVVYFCCCIISLCHDSAHNALL